MNSSKGLFKLYSGGRCKKKYLKMWMPASRRDIIKAVGVERFSWGMPNPSWDGDGKLRVLDKIAGLPRN